MEHEKGPLEEEISFGNRQFQVLYEFSGMHSSDDGMYQSSRCTYDSSKWLMFIRELWGKK